MNRKNNQLLLWLFRGYFIKIILSYHYWWHVSMRDSNEIVVKLLKIVNMKHKGVRKPQECPNQCNNVLLFFLMIQEMLLVDCTKKSRFLFGLHVKCKRFYFAKSTQCLHPVSLPIKFMLGK